MDEKRTSSVACAKAVAVRPAVLLVVLGLLLAAAGVWLDHVAGICDNGCATQSAGLWLGVPGAALALFGLWLMLPRRER